LEHSSRICQESARLFEAIPVTFWTNQSGLGIQIIVLIPEPGLFLLLRQSAIIPHAPQCIHFGLYLGFFTKNAIPIVAESFLIHVKGTWS
jgi:hypothetical protein